MDREKETSDVQPQIPSLLIQEVPDGWWAFWCPGCKEKHYIPSRHVITGTPESPTVTPVIRHSWNNIGTTPKGGICRTGEGRCHILIREGKLHYSADTTHALRCQIIDMVPGIGTWG